MKYIIFSIASLLMSPSLSAQEAKQEAKAPDARNWSASLGIGAAFKKNLRVGNTYENLDKKFLIRPIPLVQASYGRFSLGGQGLSFQVLGSKLAEAKLFIKRDGDRYHGVGMIPRKDSAFVGTSMRFLNYSFTVSRDIHGRSKSWTTQFNYGKMFLLNEKFFLLTNFGLDWFDDRYAEYYYGVRKHEATSSRREYHLNNYIQPSVGVLPVYKLTGTSSLMGALSVKLVAKEVRESPTMNGDRLELGGLFGYSYNF